MKNLTESSNFEKANNLYLSYMWQWLKKHQNYLTAVSNSKLIGVNVKKIRNLLTIIGKWVTFKYAIKVALIVPGFLLW